MPDCRQNKNFPQKMDSVTFACLLKSNLMQKMKKKKKTQRANPDQTVLEMDEGTNGQIDLNSQDPPARGQILSTLQMPL